MEKKNEVTPKFWFVCKHCSRAFTKRIQLRQHKKLNHWSEYHAEIGGTSKHETRNMESSGTTDVNGDEMFNMGATDTHTFIEGSATILVTNSRPISMTAEIQTTTMTPAKSAVAKPQAIVGPATYTSQTKAAATTSSGTPDHSKKVSRTRLEDEETDTEESRSQAEVFNCPACDQQFSTLSVWFSHITEAHRQQLESSNTELSSSAPQVEKFQAKPSISVQRPAPSKSNRLRSLSVERQQHSEDKSPVGKRSTSFIQRTSPTADTMDHFRSRSLKTGSNRRFQCQKCPKDFRTERLYREHMNIHIGRRPHRCPFCSMRFFSSSTNYKHIMELHADQIHSSKTATSKAASQKQSHHVKHQHSDDSESSPQKKRNRAQEPDQPEIRIETVFSIADGEASPSGHDEPYECNICHEVFKRLEVLRTHLRITHKIPGREAMKRCGAVQLQESELEDEGEGSGMSPRGKKIVMGQRPTLNSLEPSRAVSNEEVALSGMESGSFMKSSIRTNLKPKSRNTAETVDHKINRSLARTRHGYKCFLCTSYFSQRIAMLRHYSGEHPSLFQQTEQDSAMENSAYANDNEYAHQQLQRVRLPEASMDQQQAERDEKKPDERFMNLQNPSRKRKTRRRKGMKVQYKCNYCPQYFSAGYLPIHERFHTGERPFKCTVCPKAFAAPGILKNHYASHYDIAKVGQEYICPDSCGYSTGLKRLMFSHIRRLHRMPDLTRGKVSQKSQSSATAVSFGTESTHPVSPKNIGSAGQCKTVPDTGETGNTNRHISTATVKEAGNKLKNRVHPKSQGKSQCPYCRKKFYNHYIVTHIRIHTGEKPFSCRFCPKKFHRPDFLKEHLYRKHSRPMTEEDIKPQESVSSEIESTTNTEADVSGNSRNNLLSSSSENDETAQPTGNASLSDFPGQVLTPGKNSTIVSASAKSAAKRKGPIHQCIYCSRMLPTFQGLQEHMSTHTGQKLYGCSLCDKSFCYKSSFNKHRKTAHGGSSACVLRNPIRAQNYISKPSEAQGYSESDDEGNGNSTAATPPMKISSSGPSSIPIRRSAQTAKTTKQTQACMLCDALTAHLKIHLTTTHNMSEEKAEKLVLLA